MDDDGTYALVSENENYVNYTETNDVNYTGRVIISIYFILVSILGFMGNVIILIVLFKIPKMRTHTNIFIGSLAVSDLTTCAIIPFLVAGILSKTGWPLSDGACIATSIFRFTSQGSSVWNLVIIALNRLVLVTMSTRIYRKLYQPSTIAINIAFVWLFPLTTVIVPYLAGAIDLGFDSGPNICSDTDMDRNGNPSDVFQWIQGIVLSCLPLSLVTISYVRIYIFVRSHIRHQDQRKKSTTISMSTSRSTTGIESNSISSNEKLDCDSNTRPKKPQGGGLKSRLKSLSVRHSSRLETRITKNCFYVFLGFLFCIIPYGICILADIGFEGAPLAMVFLLTNACLNPIIYGTKHPLFKAAMLNILTARFSRDSNIPGAASSTRQNDNPQNSKSNAEMNRIDHSQDLM